MNIDEMVRTSMDQLAHDIEPTVPDPAAVRARVNRRSRIRSIAAIGLAAAAAIAVIVAGAALTRSGERGNEPVDHPTPTVTQPPETAPVRKITYADGFSSPTIHFGDRVVKIGSGFVHIDVTDDGFVYTTPDALFAGQKGDPRVWFSDGGRPEQIGSHCGPNLPRTPDDVVAGNSGSLVAWFDCTEAARPALVVLDTSTDREVVHQPIPGCGTRSRWCGLNAVIGEHVYLTRLLIRHVDPGPSVAGQRGLSLDLTTGRLSAVTPPYSYVGGSRDSAAYLEDVTSHPRGLVVGDTWKRPASPPTGSECPSG